MDSDTDLGQHSEDEQKGNEQEQEQDMQESNNNKGDVLPEAFPDNLETIIRRLDSVLLTPCKTPESGSSSSGSVSKKTRSMSISWLSKEIIRRISELNIQERRQDWKPPEKAEKTRKQAYHMA